VAEGFFRSGDWIFADFLFRELFQIFESEDQAFAEIADAYYNNDVLSARVPVGTYGPLWRKWERNAPEFCRKNPLHLIEGAILCERTLPFWRKWALFFSRTAAYRRWPSLRGNSVSGEDRNSWPWLAQNDEAKVKAFILDIPKPIGRDEAQRITENHFKCRLDRTWFREVFKSRAGRVGRPTKTP
jgi:hypothetical protein